MHREPRACILYVEDDPSGARLVQRVLEAEGFDVHIVTDGMAALEAARQLRPDLILMDINISGLDGYEVTTRLRALKELKDIPIVAVTAATLRGDRERALIAGCDGYIPKPIDVDRFPQQVRAFLSGLRERIESPQEKVDYLVEYSRRLVERLEEKIRELEKAHAELQRLDKMKTDFIILAGHELRTPLTAIYGYAQILLAMPEIPGDPMEEGTPRNLLEQVVRATRRLTQVVDDILHVFLIEANKLELSVGPVFLNPLVQNVVRNIRNLGPERQLTFEFEGLETLPMLIGDAQRLFQALWHVVSNAVKYTPDGGTIRIAGRVVDHTVHLIIQDTGIGIDPADRERIFDRFYVVENTSLHHSSKTAFKGGGLGLGLSLARGIIEAHKGRIWIESEGRDEVRLPGTTVHILLPLPKSEK
jgi:signal transduction histidine kinase